MRDADSRAVLRILTFTLVLGVSACGSVRWEKPGASSTDVANELEACRKEAQAKSGPAAALPLPSVGDPRFGPMGPSQADMRMQEAQAASTCMRAKGYVLVPDK